MADIKHIQNQKTIKNEIHIDGIGLHTGVKTTAIFKPALENTGIRFKRLDLDNCPEIIADIDHVVDISRGTTIGQNNFKIHTVEHILSAVYGLEIDNILIELTEKEPPVMDGSASPFVEVLKQAGIENQSVKRRELIIDKVISYSDPDREVDIHVLPCNEFKITFMTDYKVQQLGTQYANMNSLKNEFITEFAPARTFCLFSEILHLNELGLIKGGNLKNALIFVDSKLEAHTIDNLKNLFNTKTNFFVGENGLLNGTKLRFSNEPVRHKIVDLIGDFALLGIPIRGHIIATKSGHAANVELIKKIKENYSTKIIQAKYQHSELPLNFDIKSIMKILPHRYPFLLIDKIINLVPGKVVEAIKNVSINEPFFQGHFPGQPIFPGVLILEAMAQAGGFLVLNSISNPEKKLMYFTGINSSRFKKTVIPGDQIKFQVSLNKFRLGTCKIIGIAKVEDNIVAEAEMLASVVERES